MPRNSENARRRRYQMKMELRKLTNEKQKIGNFQRSAVSLVPTFPNPYKRKIAVARERDTRRDNKGDSRKTYAKT